jgi:hypothetical protein
MFANRTPASNNSRSAVGQKLVIGGQWVIASAVGMLLGPAIFALLRAVPFVRSVLSDNDSPLIVQFMSTIALMGASLGFAQWLVLRRHLTNSGWWVLASAAGYGLGSEVTLIANDLVFLEAWPTDLLLGLIVGLLQWWVLQRYVRLAGFWVVGSVVVAYVVPWQFVLFAQFIESFTDIAGGLIVGALVGVCTAPMLLVLLPLRKAASERPQTGRAEEGADAKDRTTRRVFSSARLRVAWIVVGMLSGALTACLLLLNTALLGFLNLAHDFPPRGIYLLGVLGSYAVTGWMQSTVLSPVVRKAGWMWATAVGAMAANDARWTVFAASEAIGDLPVPELLWPAVAGALGGAIVGSIQRWTALRENSRAMTWIFAHALGGCLSETVLTLFASDLDHDSTASAAVQVAQLIRSVAFKGVVVGALIGTSTAIVLPRIVRARARPARTANIAACGYREVDPSEIRACSGDPPRPSRCRHDSRGERRR